MQYIIIIALDTIFSIDAKIAFNKIQHSFITKSLNKLRTKGNVFKLIKGNYEKLINNITINDKRLIRNKTRIPTLPTSIQHCTRGSKQSTGGEGEEIKGLKIGKKEVKLSLVLTGMTLYTKHHKK